ncbi:hypothetical protein N480_21070 [Pseudoalteromonas luteoviolacea S2607]|uniref:hypothetical protein n=1 Tax=Pseudoalteromonas luteoviolacea TaxID=43657 RepID=UPI0007B16CFA|nr:hypothetical protein [Pseudoalteromonas luteoviolacea]KZN34519.1 hypothetical protein N480_21070 [Pseudoalteromonas luteoviolacea S2607]
MENMKMNKANTLQKNLAIEINKTCTLIDNKKTLRIICGGGGGGPGYPPMERKQN